MKAQAHLVEHTPGDARLISAAPELLRLVKEYQSVMPWTDAAEAIAKAEGRGMNHQPVPWKLYVEATDELLQAAKDFVYNVKHQKVAGYGDSEVQFDASFKELEAAIAKAEGRE